MNKFKQVLNKGKEKAEDLWIEYGDTIITCGCWATVAFYSYQFGKIISGMQAERGLQECFKQDPELEKRLFDACTKAKENQIPWDSLH